MVDFKQLAEQYKEELLYRVLPFWLEHSQDAEFGGYFTTLQPNELICIEHRSIAVQASEVSAELGIL